jgi:flagellar basal-body rod protein FlgF
MLLRLQNSVASMSEQAQRQEQIANNLANANTVGFKAQRSFTQVLSEQLDSDGTLSTQRVTTQWADTRPGVLEATGNPLDLALAGEGFFVATDEQSGESRYTRAGRFVLDEEGLIRTPEGLAVEGEAGPLRIPSGGVITVSASGEVSADGHPVGKLSIVQFEEPHMLRRLDGAAFDAGEAIPEPLEKSDIRQGFVETSNVDTIREMTRLISHLRLFESQQKALQTTDQVLAGITRDLGRF